MTHDKWKGIEHWRSDVGETTVQQRKQQYYRGNNSTTEETTVLQRKQQYYRGNNSTTEETCPIARLHYAPPPQVYLPEFEQVVKKIIENILFPI